MRNVLRLSVIFALAACASGRVKQYSEMLDPLVGTGTRNEVEQLLGKPKECSQERGMLRCEYRTVGVGEAMNGDTRPGSFTPFAGREIAEQQNSDVLNLWYDYRGKLKEWQPTAIMP